MKKRRGRGRRGRGRSRSFYDNGVHGNMPLPGSSGNPSAVARGDSASVIIGVEGDEKGPRKKVRCCVPRCLPPHSPSSSQLQEEKRRALVLKAKADRIKKRADLHRTILTHRKIAQRQRRERERQMMRLARERQDKISRQKEVEVCVFMCAFVCACT